MEKINVLIPAYNAEKTIKETIDSVLCQRHDNFDIIVVDNCSTDMTAEVVGLIPDPRIRLFKNQVNIGCGRNLTKCVAIADAERLFFLCADDVLISSSALIAIDFVFNRGAEVVTRNYYWFEKNPLIPARRKKQYKNEKHMILSSIDQISGIAVKKSSIKNSFSAKPFIEMASVLYPMIKEKRISYYLETPMVAVRIHDIPKEAFKESPLKTWHDLVEGDKDITKNFLAKNYVGLVQIKTSGTMAQLLREIKYLIKYRKENLLNLKFWFYALGTLLIPRRLLKKMVKIYRGIKK